jgi:hypothetical protein
MVSMRTVAPLPTSVLIDPDRASRIAGQMRAAFDTGDAEALRRALTEAKQLRPDETKELLRQLGPRYTRLLRDAISGPLRTDDNGVPLKPWMPSAKSSALDGIRIDKQPLTAEQTRNARAIIDEGRRRGLGDRDIQVALMTAIQESRLRNLKGGDRDSVGLFQQRPSQGWGTAKQLNDPQYAAGKFYDALVRVRDRDTMRLTEVAQKVQASAYPNAYAKWETQARDLLRGL